jgi:hypothetical protein
MRAHKLRHFGQFEGATRLNPGTPLGYAELLIRHRIERVRAVDRQSPADVGASVIEWVIISALLVGIAVTVGAILLQKIQDKATSINLDGGGNGTGTP